MAWLLQQGQHSGWWQRARLDGGHRDAPGASTECPGAAAAAAVAQINELAAGPPVMEEQDMGYAQITVDNQRGRAFATFTTRSRSTVMGDVWVSLRSLWGRIPDPLLTWLGDDGRVLGPQNRVAVPMNMRVNLKAPDGATGLTVEWDPAAAPAEAVLDGCLEYSPH